MKKLFILFLGFLFIIPQVSFGAVIDSYDTVNYDTTHQIYSGSMTIGCQSFDAGVGYTLGSVDFYLKKVGSPTGNAQVKIFAHSGTYGSTSVTTGSYLAVSTTVLDVSTLTTSYALTSFAFSSYDLTASTKYLACIEYTGGSASDYVGNQADSSSPSHSGNFSYADGTLPTGALSAHDAIFYVNSAVSSGGGGGTATSTVSSTTPQILGYYDQLFPLGIIVFLLAFMAFGLLFPLNFGKLFI